MARAVVHAEVVSPVDDFTPRQFAVAAAISAIVHLGVFVWLALPQFEEARLAGGGASFGISGSVTGSGSTNAGNADASEEAVPKESGVEPSADEPESASQAAALSRTAQLPNETERAPVETPPEARATTTPRPQTGRTSRSASPQGAQEATRRSPSSRAASEERSARPSDRTRSKPTSSGRSGPDGAQSAKSQAAAGQANDGGSDTGTGTGSGSATNGAGDAATSNYTGIVTEHIRRNRRSNAVGAGEAILRIAIEGNGQVRDLDIYRSSGSTRFDRQALRMARIAAPYPEPPAGQGPVLVRIRGR